MTSHISQQGSVTLGLVFGLGMLAVGIAAATLTFSTSAITNNTVATQGVRSLVTADAAAREGVYRVIDSVSGQTVNFTSALIPQLNDSNNASVSTSGTWPIVTVTGTAGNQRTTRKITADIDLFPSAFAFDQAVYTHGELNFNGNVTVDGDVYATNGIDLSGSADVTGNAYTPDDIHTAGSADVAGESVDNHPEILPPEIDITPYSVEALTNGTHYPLGTGVVASNIIKNTTISGTYFIDDSASISGNNTDFTGVLVVTGNLSLNGGDYTADTDNPLVIYVGGNLELTGNVTINGIVYVEGQTTFGVGTPELNGALISVNNANSAGGSGNVTITYDPDYADAWSDITGLDTESGTDPIVKNWHEE